MGHFLKDYRASRSGLLTFPSGEDYKNTRYVSFISVYAESTSSTSNKMSFVSSRMHSFPGADAFYFFSFLFFFFSILLFPSRIELPGQERMYV